MFIRAAFWVGLVAMLMPGRGALPKNGCSGRVACSAAAELTGRISAATLQSLSKVKHEIEAAERARK